MEQGALSHWLRLLWGRAPALHLDAEQPFIADGALHLPPRSAWHGHCAAAAHATAHLVYSPPRVDASGLAPLARALWGLLEDARVEALAARELPGLWRQWRPLHTVCVDDGTGLETLLRRLARALADPAYADPHPWVGKGRRLFYLDAAQEVMAPHTPADLRQVASRLGHDIGQMRLRFDARSYRPAPDYRDDHRWMFPAEALAPTARPPAARGPGGAREDAGPVGPQERRTRHPEWDRLIGRNRPDWTTVLESPATAVVPGAESDGGPDRMARRLRQALMALVRPMASRSRAADGNTFDLDALVQWQVSRRSHAAADHRVHRGRRRHTVRGAAWVLIDRSTSTAADHGGGRSVLQASARTAAALAAALQGLGIDCTVAGFCSTGRHAVRVSIVKSLQAPFDAGFAARLQALRPEGSTRLGAALRHATAALAAARGGARWILLLTDGEVHDIDVHDPRYLAEDARQAVRAAARQSVHTACLTFRDDVGTDMRRIVGRRRVRPVAELSALPRALQRLMD